MAESLLPERNLVLNSPVVSARGFCHTPPLLLLLLLPPCQRLLCLFIERYYLLLLYLAIVHMNEVMPLRTGLSLKGPQRLFSLFFLLFACVKAN